MDSDVGSATSAADASEARRQQRHRERSGGSSGKPSRHARRSRRRGDDGEKSARVTRGSSSRGAVSCSRRASSSSGGGSGATSDDRTPAAHAEDGAGDDGHASGNGGGEGRRRRRPREVDAEERKRSRRRQGAREPSRASREDSGKVEAAFPLAAQATEAGATSVAARDAPGAAGGSGEATDEPASLAPELSEDMARALFAAVPDPASLNALRTDSEDGMEECIRRQRRLVRRMRSYVPMLSRAEQLLQHELRQCDPALSARQLALREALARVRDARRRIEEGHHEREFEETVRRYVVAHAARVEEEDLLRGAARREHVLPTIGTGFALLDADCSRETRPPVTIEERDARTSRPAVARRPAGPDRHALASAAQRAEDVRGRGVNAPSLSEAAAACWSEDAHSGSARSGVRVGLDAHAALLSAGARVGSGDADASLRALGGHAASGPFALSAAGRRAGQAASSAAATAAAGAGLSSGVVSEMLVTLGAKRPPVDIVLPDHCPLCRVPMVKGIGEQVLICPRCHLTKTYLDSTAASMAFGEDSVEFNIFQYRRINHFNDALNELQGKEKSNVSSVHMTRIMEEMYNVFGPVPREKITYAMVRHVVRDRLQLLRCYKHVVQITSLLSGRPAIQMSPRHETLARLIFEQMQEPFERAPHRERHNFLSYPFTLFKICQMLGLVEFFPMLPLLRGEEKLRQQEDLIRWICEYRGWTAPPSVLSDPETWHAREADETRSDT